MWNFAYQAKDDQGELQSGELTASDVSSAVQQLASQDLEVLSIQRVNVVLESNATTDAATEQRRADDPALGLLSEVIERRHLWLPTIESLLQELPPGPARRATERRMQRLRGTMTVEQFLRNADAVDLLPLLSSDEQPKPSSPRLQMWLQHILQDQRRRIQLSGRWSYPLLLLAIGLVLLVGWCMFILPIFREMYDDFGLNLPAPTRLVFWMSDQLTLYALRTLLYVAAGFAVIVPFVRWWRSRALTNRIFGRFVAGTTGNLRAMSRLTGTLAELLGLRLPLASALQYAGQASAHRYFTDAAKQAVTSTFENPIDENPVNENAAEAGVPVDPTGRLPQSVVYALTAGKEGQPSIAVLRELAMIYGQIAQSRQDRSLGNLPVIGVVLLGCLVGFVVISLFMPLVSMVTSLA